MTLQKKRKASKRYKNLSKIENEKKQQYGCEYYKNLSDNEQQKLLEYRKKIFQNEKKYLIIIKLEKSILIEKAQLLIRESIKKLSSFLFMPKRFSLNKQKM